ncbi:Gmad2 immunoglobulin-like domain-containing protein [Candidatus Gracilibacteria bacterium]|nr:Gmad2 immunoglobulin-like domain-containing protein [Candidatus Gracilibacteria bacterium]MCF7898559.1 Gmad2 immunoglobulin-like domain-containing protein [Candidatus Paceibacterota bacterium]
MRKLTYIIVPVIILVGFGVWLNIIKIETPSPLPVVVISNFDECEKADNPIMESYPRRCRFGDVTFTENIGDELDKMNLIRVNNPRPNQVISSPLIIEGEARGFWFFEASFPVVLTDWDGLIIAQGIATANGDWMTENFVPFTAKLEFKNPTYKNNGALILRKDNPSGLPEHDDALEIPIIFKNIN